ncbi:hypothetical protein [Beijerinckia indica]|uniref:Uncharacterized protein n=1 Tax=Beijerinckia indica subsp. indica (strain ATCC 9039 / DSM 1715 / NCIMB 8712) TaxID=395963 RepID=B2IH16_BEII9|nr:hypothetical protein [Beijerinckia indica]ACB94430.1 conserved hypothetical protein [Beijerinckia indica subsp. indica ATCC 9039]
MSSVWNTKFGPRRVRYDPPTLKEAIIAAQGLTDQLNEQIEIAASLMDLPEAEVRTEILKSAAPRKSAQIVLSAGRERTVGRTVIVERKPARRPLGAARNSLSHS